MFIVSISHARKPFPEVKECVLKALWDSVGLVSSLLTALHGVGHPQLEREWAAEQGTETRPAASAVPRPCPRAAAPRCTLKDRAGQVSLTLGTASRATSVPGQRWLTLNRPRLQSCGEVAVEP